MRGRPVSLHAMRGISAHSNGFQTCRALHLLQMLLGTIDVPGGWRYKSPHPKACPPGPKPVGKAEQIVPGKPLPGIPLGYPLSPEDLIIDAEGRPGRIDKAFSWDAPIAAHGMMHMVIANAWKGDPYPIDTLFMYMANMAWNSAMNTAETMRMLTDTDPASGEYRIPRIIYSDSYYSEMVAYADLVLPDTTYLERWDCISLLDRPIGSPEGPADAIRQPIVAPDRDVRPFQDVLIELGARLGLPGFITPEGAPRYPGGYPDYIVNHERRPGIGPLAGWRGPEGESSGRGAPNPRQLERYIANGCFWRHELPEDQLYFKHANKGYLETAVRMGFIDAPDPIVLQLYLEPLHRFRLAAQGHGSVQPPESHRERIVTYFDPLPCWHMPFEEARIDRGTFPLHAVTQRPMQMYHSWHSQNAWLRQILGRNRLFVNRTIGRALGLDEEDWVWLSSHHGRIRVPTKLMDGVNPDTVWTWNGIGKRVGAWNLDPDSPEFREGFLLNHVISELLPPDGGYSHANADPITGQAAWYDLRVRIDRVTPDEKRTTFPSFEMLDRPASLGRPAAILRYFAGRNPSGHMGPLSDFNPYGGEAWGVWFNRIHSFEEGEGEGARTIHFPKSCLHCEEPACVTVCPTGASYKRAEDGIVLVNESICIGCKLCSWACPYGAREFDADEGVMKKCTLCIDRIYNEHLPPDERQPACVMVCPVNARHFGDLADPDAEVSKLVAGRGGGDLMPELGYKPVNKYLPPRAGRMTPSAPVATGAAPLKASESPGDRLLRWVDRILSR